MEDVHVYDNAIVVVGGQRLLSYVIFSILGLSFVVVDLIETQIIGSCYNSFLLPY